MDIHFKWISHIWIRSTIKTLKSNSKLKKKLTVHRPECLNHNWKNFNEISCFCWVWYREMNEKKWIWWSNVNFPLKWWENSYILIFMETRKTANNLKSKFFNILTMTILVSLTCDRKIKRQTIWTKNVSQKNLQQWNWWMGTASAAQQCSKTIVIASIK